MTFQRAPPEVNGFGVTTWTPGFTRSLQSRMCFGLPFRSTNTTTERVTIPCQRFLFQLGPTRRAFTRVVTSGSSENATTSARRPFTTACAWSPDAPYDCVKLTPLPAFVFPKASMSWPYASFGVEYATSETDPPFVAAPALVRRRPAATPAAAITLIAFIQAPHLPTLSIRSLDITGAGRSASNRKR